MPEPAGSSSSRTTAPTSTLVTMNSSFLVNHKINAIAQKMQMHVGVCVLTLLTYLRTFIRFTCTVRYLLML